MPEKKIEAEKLITAAARSVGRAYGGAVNKLARTKTDAERALAERKRVDAHFAKVYARKAAASRATKTSPAKKQVSPEKTRLGRAVMSAAPSGVKSGLRSLQDVLGPQKKKKKKK